MWLMNYITKNSIEKPGAVSGSVKKGAEGTSVLASDEHKMLLQCLPYGVYSVPPNGCSAVVLPVGEGEVTLGVTSGTAEINQGELALYSSGGASIILKNNGDVVINGRVFASE